MNNYQLRVPPLDKNIRIDIYLTNKFPDFSRNYFINLIKNNNLKVNNKAVKPSLKIKGGEQIYINFIEKEILSDPKAENIPIEIVYEDDNVIVVNKKPNMVVHPSAGHTGNTLVNALIKHLPEIKKVIYDKNNLISRIRPGIVHRLDKDTSGIIIVAKNARTMHSLSKQIQNRGVIKKYLGLCSGWPKSEEGELISFLGRDPKNRKMIADIGENKGKKAVLSYKVINYYYDKSQNKISLIEFDLKTGRTHQIRVQVKNIGHPILGDKAYFNKESLIATNLNKIKRQMLHAFQLEIYLTDNKKPTLFEAPLPPDMTKIIARLTEVDSR